MSGRVNTAGAGRTLLGAIWAELAAGTILLIMRIYVNAFMVRRWGADFYWALSAYVSSSRYADYRRVY